MMELFVSYHFTGKSSDQQIFQGFDNAVFSPPIYAPLSAEHIEHLENEVRKHVIEKHGFSSASVTIMNWQTLNGR